MRVWWIVMGLAACGVEPQRAPWAWQVGTRPVGVLADGSIDPWWSQMVEDARVDWSVPLVAMGCDDPFLGAASVPVVLVPDDEWTIPDAIGNTSIERIVVRGTLREQLSNESYRTILPHELGHALGLVHVLAVRDPDSVMHPTSDRTAPSAMDLDNAATAIACR